MEAQRLLRKLALNDETVVRSLLGDRLVAGDVRLDDKTEALVRLGALLSIGAATPTCRVGVEHARACGATDDELVAVLIAVAPACGMARVVSVAPRLALAIDLELDEDEWASE